MRITTQMMQRDVLSRMQTNLRQLSSAQQQVSSGLRLQRASDDPTAAAQSMRTRGSLRALDQYRRNISDATARLGAEEGVLDGLTTTLMRAKELGLSQADATATAQTRRIARAEVEQLLDHALALGNTRFGEDFLFGTADPKQPPFARPTDPASPDFTTADATAKRQTEIAAGRLLHATHSGEEVLVDSGVLRAIHDLSQGLQNDSPDDIRAALTGLDDAFQQVQTLLGDTGARANQLQVTGANLDALDINLQTFKSDLEDVDLEEAVTELVSRQTAYQAAMMATSRVIGMTLTDYLR